MFAEQELNLPYAAINCIFCDLTKVSVFRAPLVSRQAAAEFTVQHFTTRHDSSVVSSCFKAPGLVFNVSESLRVETFGR